MRERRGPIPAGFARRYLVRLRRHAVEKEPAPLNASDVFAGLEPFGLWAHFARLTEIPRPSGQEAEVSRHLVSWAEGCGLPAHQDAAGNLYIAVPASPGVTTTTPIALQAHLDMVCVREDDAPSDPARGRIRLAREGDWIRAVGSTLGADNGIAVAAMQHLVEAADLPHGPLELIFTAQEETTSAGADALDPAWVRSKTLLNLDSEEDGVLVIGSAGGIWSSMKWTAPMPGVPEGHVAVEIRLSGLQGGHSGSDISLHRLNAIQGLLRLLRAAASEAPISLSAIEGGDAFSAIPRTAHAVIGMGRSSLAHVHSALTRAKDDLVDEYRPYEPDLTAHIQTRDDLPPTGYTPTDSQRLIDLLSVIPCGVLAPDPRLPGLVETSSSLGVVAREGDDLVIQNFTRSSVMSAMRAVVDGLRAAARLAGAEFSVIPPEGPSWEADPNSRALAVARTAYHRLFGQDPRVMTVHGFLECSLLKKQIPALDIVSFGPEIRDAHRPGERVHIGSVERFSRLLFEVVRGFALEGRM